MRNYLAFIHKDAGSDYTVTFPDFPGCITAGSTLDEARAMAQEALPFHLEGLIEDGETLADPMLLEEALEADPANRQGEHRYQRRGRSTAERFRGRQEGRNAL